MAAKRRASGEGTLSKSKRGYWVARIELPPTYDETGKPKRRRLEKSSKSQRVVLDWLAETKREIATHGGSADATITVARWAERWLDIKATQLKPGSIKIYRSMVRNWLTPTIGKKRLAKVTPADIRRVTDAMRTAGKSAINMHNTHNTIVSIFSDAVREGIIHSNPAKKIKAPRKPSRAQSRGTFTARQVANLIATEARLGSCRFTVQLLTGMRQAETLGLTWDNVNLDAGELTVLWQLQSLPRRHRCGTKSDGGWLCGYKLGAYCPKGTPDLPDGLVVQHLISSQYLVPPKSGHPRTVPLLPLVVAALRRHYERTIGHPSPHGLVFPRHDGKPRRPDNDQHAWKTLLAEAGIPPGPTTHWARHTLATLMMEAGVDAKVVGEIVGHSTARITREVYQHTSSQLARDSMKKLGELLG